MICKLRRHSKKEESVSSQSITVTNYTTNLLNQAIGIQDHTLDQTTNISNQISNVPDQIGEYWLDYSMTDLGEITVNGIHKT